MTPQEEIKKAIKHFENVRNGAVVVLDSGFGNKENESNIVYKNRKMYAELAISALELKQQIDDLNLTIEDIKAMKEKQIPKQPLKAHGGANRCPNCQMKHFDPEWVGTKYCDCGQALDWSGDDD